MLTRRTLIGTAAAMAGAVAAPKAMAQPAPVLIRWGYLLPPLGQFTSIFTLKPELLKHHGKTYNFEARVMRGTSLLVTAFAAGEIDVGNLGFAAFVPAVLNAGMTDMKIIGDESEDGFNGQFSSQIRVRKDSGINSIADLKGKVIAVTAMGGGIDMLVRYTLRKKAGLELNRDFTYLETPFPTMKAMLIENKVNAAFFAQPFASDPEVAEQTKVLFTNDDVFGPLMQNFICARGGFIEKNRPAMVDFLEDFLRVVRWYYDPKNREESIKIIAEASKTPEAVLRRYIFTKQDNYRNLDGLPDLKVIQDNWAAMKELGLSRQELNVNEYADLSLMKEAAARLKS